MSKTNYLSNPAAARDPRLLASRRNSGDNTSTMSMHDKKKEAEYVKRIHQLEGVVAKWVQAQGTWEQEKLQLQTEKTLLARQYEELRIDSDKRSSDLQRQIDEIKSAFNSGINEEQRVRKKSKKRTSIDASIIDSQQPQGSQSSPTQMDTTPSIPKTERPPPIFVYGVTNYTEFARFLSLNGVEECTRKETNREFILNTKTVDQYRKLHSVLRTECVDKTNKDKFGTIQIHSYQLKSERAFIVYIRGLPRTMDPSKITAALQELGYNPRRTVNVQRKENDQLLPRPLFRIELEPNADNPKIYELTNLLHVRITVESFKPRSEPPHCRNCQRVGHTKLYCLRTPRCIKCGGEHKSESCSILKTDPCKCANCGGPHPANYKGCEAFRKLRKTPHKATDEIRRREPLTSSEHQPSLNPPSHSPAERKTFASILRSAGASQQPPPVGRTQFPLPTHNRSSETDLASIADLLHSLSNQISQLSSRLDNLEHKQSPSDWHVVPPRKSRKHHG